VRERGGGALLYLVAQRLQQRTKPHLHVEWFLLLQTSPPQGDDEERAIAPVWLSHTSDAPRLTGLGLSLEEATERLRRGCRCAAVFEGERLVAYLWVHPEASYNEEGVVFRIGRGDVWIFDGVVDPDYRGQRIHPRLFTGMAEDLRGSLGMERLVSTIDAVNVSSGRAARRRGGVMLGSYLVFKLGPLRVLRERLDRPRWRVGRRDFEIAVPVISPRG